MSNTFFRYSGTKLKYTKQINRYINQSSSNIYVEPFVGSGAVLFNLEKEFNEYIVNDIDRNITRIYKTFKEINYNDYLKEIEFIESKFGSIKDSKESYYNFRNWFNDEFWNTNTTKEGIYLHFLANSCINSFLRFSKNGMNQSYGKRFYKLDLESFDKIKSVLGKTKIFNLNYRDIFKKYPNALYFLDPPYFSQKSSYSGFISNDLIEFLKLIEDKEYIYTDILNEFNNSLENRELIREMVSTSPNRKIEKNGNIEYIFSSIILDDGDILDEF